MRVARVQHQTDAGREEAGCRRGGTAHLPRELGRERAPHRGHVHTRLLEHLSAQHAHHPAAAGRPGLIGPLPRADREVGIRSAFALDRGQFGADAVAQAFEPGAGGGAAIACFGQNGLLVSTRFACDRSCTKDNPFTLGVRASVWARAG